MKGIKFNMMHENQTKLNNIQIQEAHSIQTSLRFVIRSDLITYKTDKNYWTWAVCLENLFYAKQNDFQSLSMTSNEEIKEVSRNISTPKWSFLIEKSSIFFSLFWNYVIKSSFFVEAMTRNNFLFTKFKIQKEFFRCWNIT